VALRDLDIRKPHEAFLGITFLSLTDDEHRWSTEGVGSAGKRRRIALCSGSAGLG